MFWHLQYIPEAERPEIVELWNEGKGDQEARMQIIKRFSKWGVISLGCDSCGSLVGILNDLDNWMIYGIDQNIFYETR